MLVVKHGTTHWSIAARGCAAKPALSTASKRSRGPHAAESNSTTATPVNTLTAADLTPLTLRSAPSTADEHEVQVMPATRSCMRSGPWLASTAPRAAASKPQSSTALTSVSWWMPGMPHDAASTIKMSGQHDRGVVAKPVCVRVCHVDIRQWLQDCGMSNNLHQQIVTHHCTHSRVKRDSCLVHGQRHRGAGNPWHATQCGFHCPSASCAMHALY